MGGRLHTRFLSLKKSGLSLRESLSKPREKPRSTLIPTSHTGPMKPETLRGIGLSLMGVLTLAVWAYIIWMACYVSTIILQTLQSIVDLAAITG